MGGFLDRLGVHLPKDRLDYLRALLEVLLLSLAGLAVVMMILRNPGKAVEKIAGRAVR